MRGRDRVLTVVSLFQVNYGGVATKNSPYRVYAAQPLNPAAVQVFGPGVEKGVKTNSPTHFNIDCRDAGEGTRAPPRRRW